MPNLYIFDLDGTVYLGDELLPGAAEVITHSPGWRSTNSTVTMAPGFSAAASRWRP